MIARKLPVETYVPGHGQVHVGRGVADLEELNRYFAAMRGEVSRMIAQGKTEQQVVAEFKTPAPFDKYGQAGGNSTGSCRSTIASSRRKGSGNGNRHREKLHGARSSGREAECYRYRAMRVSPRRSVVMSRFVLMSVAGVLIGAAVPVFTGSAVAQGEQIYTSCEHRFAVIYPGQPKTRDLTYIDERRKDRPGPGIPVP